MSELWSRCSYLSLQSVEDGLRDLYVPSGWEVSRTGYHDADTSIYSVYCHKVPGFEGTPELIKTDRPISDRVRTIKYIPEGRPTSVVGPSPERNESGPVDSRLKTR